MVDNKEEHKVKINKYSNVITEVRDTAGDRWYIFYKNELVAFGTENKFYIEPQDRRKKSVMDFIKGTYAYKYEGAKIEDCYSLNNMLAKNAG